MGAGRKVATENGGHTDEGADLSSSNPVPSDFRSTTQLFQVPVADVTDSSFADQEHANHRQLRRRKLRVIKNVAVLSSAWLFIYIGLTPISSMQSSLNARQGLGTFTMALGSASRLITSLFLTNLLLHKMGVKRLICCGALLVSAFMAANFYPVWATLAPGAILAGAGNGLMWVGQSIYMGHSVRQYSELVDTPVRTVNVRMFGSFYGLYYCNHVIGHVASSFILGAGTSAFTARPATSKGLNVSLGHAPSLINAVPIHRNASLLGYDPATTCGAQFCNQDLGTSMSVGKETSRRRPSDARIYSLCGFCLGSVLLGVALLIFFLDPLDHKGGNEEEKEMAADKKLTPDMMDDPGAVVDLDKSSCVLLGETLMQLKDPKLLLLLPLFAYNGFDDSFLSTELTKAYITCAVGVEYIGFISAIFGVCCPLSALLCGWLNSPKTRFLPFVLMTAAHLSCLFGLFVWDLETPILYLFVISAVWGIGSGACGSQTSGICNVFFADKLATTYSNSVLWSSVGSAFFFGISSVLCSYVKFYLLGAIIVVALVGVATLELIVYFKTRKGSKK